MLFGLIRQKGYSKIADLDYVILKPEGKLSVFPRSQIRPVQPKDLKIATPYEGIAYPLVVDGTVIKDTLEIVDWTEDILMGELKLQGHDLHKVVLAELDSGGNLFITSKSPTKL